jgi:hypothetical protein
MLLSEQLDAPLITGYLLSRRWFARIDGTLWQMGSVRTSSVRLGSLPVGIGRDMDNACLDLLNHLMAIKGEQFIVCGNSQRAYRWNGKMFQTVQA